MDDFERFASQTRVKLDGLRKLLIQAENDQIAAAAMAQRAEHELFGLFQNQHMAERWRDAYRTGLKNSFPTGYDHTDNCKLGSELFIIEAAVHGVNCDLFLDLHDVASVKESLEKGTGALLRAEDFLKELKWFRRWRGVLSGRGSKFGGVKDLLNVLRAVREGLFENAALIQLVGVSRMNSGISTANQIVRQSVMAIHRAADGLPSSVPPGKAEQDLIHLNRMSLDMARFSSSREVLKAMERVAISQAFIWWSLSMHAVRIDDQIGAQIRLSRAIRSFGQANYYRQRQRHLFIWLPIKTLAGNYRADAEPEWGKLLPTPAELKIVRKRLTERLDRVR